MLKSFYESNSRSDTDALIPSRGGLALDLILTAEDVGVILLESPPHSAPNVEGPEAAALV